MSGCATACILFVRAYPRQTQETANQATSFWNQRATSSEAAASIKAPDAVATARQASGAEQHSGCAIGLGGRSFTLTMINSRNSLRP
jgi:hypothetical protein